jgi:hypothetical protein
MCVDLRKGCFSHAGGGMTEAARAAELTRQLGVPIAAQQVCMLMGVLIVLSCLHVLYHCFGLSGQQICVKGTLLIMVLVVSVWARYFWVTLHSCLFHTGSIASALLFSSLMHFTSNLSFFFWSF